MQPPATRTFWVGFTTLLGVVIAASAIYLGRSDKTVASALPAGPTPAPVQVPQTIAHSAAPNVPNAIAPDGTVLVFDGKQFVSQLDHDLMAAARADIKSGIEFVNAHYPEAKRQHVLRWLVVELAKDHLEAMLEILPLLTSEIERRGALQLIAEHWAGQGITAYRKFVNANFTGTQKNEVQRDFANVLARKGLFDEAITTLREMPESYARTSAATDIARSYCEKDPMRAIQWASMLETYDERTAAQRALLSELSEVENVDAMKALMASVPESKRSAVLQQIGQAMGKTGVGELTQVSPEPAEEKDRGYLLVGAVSTAPRAGMPALGKQLAGITDPQARTQATANYVSRLFQMDPGEAVAWVNAAPQENRAAAVSALTSSWYRTDAKAALQWVNGLPKGSDQDWALESLSWKFMQNEPDRAMEFAQRVGDGRIRDGLVRNIQARQR